MNGPEYLKRNIISIYPTILKLIVCIIAICLLITTVFAVTLSEDSAFKNDSTNYLSDYLKAETGTEGRSYNEKSATWSTSDDTYTIIGTGAYAVVNLQGVAQVTLTPKVYGTVYLDYDITLSSSGATAKINDVSVTTDSYIDQQSPGYEEVTAYVNGNGYNRQAKIVLSNIAFTPWHTIHLVSADGGNYTCLKNGTVTTQTEFTEPGVTVTASSISASATTYTLSATVTDAENWQYQGWQVSTDGVNWTTVDPDASATDEWALDSNGNYLFTPAADWYIKPYFVKNEIETTFKSVEGGAYSVNTSEGTSLEIAEKTADSGVDQTNKEVKDWAYEITATPRTGYYLVGYEINKGEGIAPTTYYISPTQNTYTFSAENNEAFTVDAAYTVYPLFVEAVNVTLKAPGEGIASYTVTAAFNGKTVTLPFTDPITTEQTITVPAGTTLTLSATLANTDTKTYEFACWTMGDISGSTVQTNAQVTVTGNTAIGPLAVEATGIYQVDNDNANPKLCSTWEQAMAEAVRRYSANNDGTQIKVILLDNVDLPDTMAANGLPENGGTYVQWEDGEICYKVPAQVKLLLPYSAGNHDINNTTATNGTSSTLAYANRAFTQDHALKKFDTESGLHVTLTIPHGTKVETAGVISVGGTIFAVSGESISGAPAGAHSNIQLNGSIDVTSTGKLSVLGYVLGEGSITVAKDGAIYQLFTVMDYRSGGYTVSAAGGDDYKATPVSGENLVAPFLRYAFINIQTPIRIQNGGNLYGYCDMFNDKVEKYGITAVNAQHNVTNMWLIGSTSEALIDLSAGGSVYIEYDSTKTSNAHTSTETIGKTTVTIAGGGNMGVSSLNVKAATIEKSVSTDSFTFPIPYNFDIRLLAAENATDPTVYTISEPIAFLPGSSLYVGENAKLELSGNNIVAFYDGLYDHTSTGSPMAYGTVGVNHYPYTSQLNKAAFHYGTAALVVDGTLEIGSQVQFGGTIQTNGTGVVDVKSGAVTQCTTQVGLVGHTEIGIDFGLTVVGNEYYYAGATVRTLTAQLMNSNGKLFDMQQGETYYGVDNLRHTLDSYTYNLYTKYDYNATTGDGIEAITDPLYARIVGSWCTNEDPTHDHKMETSVVSATCDTPGYTKHTCTACGYSYTDTFTEPHSQADCTHMTGSLVDIYGASVQAGDSLNMYFYVREADMSTLGSCKAVITRVDEDANVSRTEIASADWEAFTSGGQKYRRFCYTEFSGKEMSDMVYVTLYSADGTSVLSNVYAESIENYAVDLLATIADQTDPSYVKLRTVLVDMLNYGASCQTFFEYNIDQLANARTGGNTGTTSSPIFGTEITNTDTVRNYFISQSVSTRDTLVYSFYFQNIDPTKGATVSYTDHYGKTVTPEVTIVEVGTNLYRVDVPGLAIADGYADNALISCTVTPTGENATAITAYGRISNYARSAAGLYTDVDVFAMLMRFAQSAYTYFHEVANA